MIKNYDFIAIGGGSGGFNAARVARGFTDSVAIVDGASELGGLCILRGCMPSKTLIYSAEVLHLAQNARKFGLDIPSAKVDMPALHRRKIDIIKEFTDYRVGAMKSDKYALFQSHAKFIGRNVIELEDGTQLQGKKFIIATGSSVSVPSIPGLDHPEVWNSDHVLDLDSLPESIIVLGGGVVACELAQYLQRIGSRVIQIQRSPHILKEQATDISEVVEKAFRDDGIELYTGTSLFRIEKTDTGFVAHFTKDGKSLAVSAERLVNALGRSPNTTNLALDAAGVERGKSGQIKTDEHQRTTNPDIYAAGDVTGPYEIVHTAVLQGEYAARHAFGQPGPAPLNYDHMLEVIFTDPQIASVGLSEKQIKERELDYLAADYPFDDHGKSILMEAKYGFARLFAERPTGRILGAEIVSKDAGELIHALSVAVSNNLTAADLLKTHWYHPTLSEIISYPLEDIVDAL